MEEIKAYKCTYCGKPYTSPDLMAECILKCSSEKKRKEKFERDRKLRETKQRRYDEIEDDIKKLLDKINTYYNDYDEIVYFVADVKYNESDFKNCIKNTIQHAQTNR